MRRTVAADWSTSRARRPRPCDGSRSHAGRGTGGGGRQADDGGTGPAGSRLRAAGGKRGAVASGRARVAGGAREFDRGGSSVRGLHCCAYPLTWHIPCRALARDPRERGNRGSDILRARPSWRWATRPHVLLRSPVHRRPRRHPRHHRVGGVARQFHLCQVVEGRLGHQPRRLRLRPTAARPTGADPRQDRADPRPADRPLRPAWQGAARQHPGRRRLGARDGRRPIGRPRAFRWRRPP